jgi:hypothetical protein
MPYTCRCGWQGKIDVDALLVSRAGELRSRRLSARDRHAAWRQRRRLRSAAILLGALAGACGVLGAFSGVDQALWYWGLGAVLGVAAAFVLRRRRGFK